MAVMLRYSSARHIRNQGNREGAKNAKNRREENFVDFLRATLCFLRVLRGCLRPCPKSCQENKKMRDIIEGSASISKNGQILH
jgi:hypothetical protein